jgi:ferredoxin--NADP+ reductase
MATAAEKYQKVKLTWRKDYSPDLWSIRVQSEEKLNFDPGQYATLGVETNSRTIERPYSIVSSPLEDELEFFFELVPEGALTPLLYKLGPGDETLMRRRPKGLFKIDWKSGHPNHYLLSTVTGLAPYVSMARTFAKEAKKGTPPNVNLIILQGASRSWEFGYQEELEELAYRSDWLEFIPTVSRPWEDSDWKGEVGRVEDVLRKYLDALNLTPSTTTAYLCGHPQMIENGKDILKRKGFTKESLREEVYWVPASK